jgi:hypothetical protein
VATNGGDALLRPLHTSEDVIEHLAYNYIRNGVEAVTRLDGWADCGEDDVSYGVTDSLAMVAENG